LDPDADILEALRERWRTLTSPDTSSWAREDALTAFGADLGNLHRHGLEGSVVLGQLAEWLATKPVGLDELNRALIDALVTCRGVGPMPSEARRRLRAVAMRTNALGVGPALEVAIEALPDTLEIVERHFRERGLGPTEEVARQATRILLCESPSAREQLVRLILSKLPHDEAEAFMRGLPDDEALWQLIAEATIGRPTLQGPLVSHLRSAEGASRPRAALVASLEQIARFGSPRVEADVRALIEPFAPADLAAPGADSAERPWSEAERSAIKAVLEGGLVTAEARTGLERLLQDPSAGDLVSDLALGLAERLETSGAMEMLVDICSSTHLVARRSAAEGLLRHFELTPSAKLDETQQTRLMKTIRALSEDDDLRLTLARLALPESFPLWFKARQRWIGPDDIPLIDLRLALRLPEAPICLEHVLVTATDKQRQALIAALPLSPWPVESSRIVILLESDPATLAVLLERLIAERPSGYLDALDKALDSPRLAPALRQSILTEFVTFGDHHHVGRLGLLRTEDADTARQALIGRLAAKGGAFATGALTLASEAGGLALAQGIISSTGEDDRAAKPDPRGWLRPPPRALGFPVWLTCVFLGGSGYGLGMTPLFVVSLVMTPMITGSLPMLPALLSFLFCVLGHLIGRTTVVLEAMGSGVLRFGTVVTIADLEAPGANAEHPRLLLEGTLGPLEIGERYPEVTMLKLLNGKAQPTLVLLDGRGNVKDWVLVEPIPGVRISKDGRFELTAFGIFSFCLALASCLTLVLLFTGVL
jgi:hypothetical protein